jgi:hypothetical protein
MGNNTAFVSNEGKYTTQIFEEDGYWFEPNMDRKLKHKIK